MTCPLWPPQTNNRPSVTRMKKTVWLGFAGGGGGGVVEAVEAWLRLKLKLFFRWRFMVNISGPKMTLQNFSQVIVSYLCG